MMKINQYLEFLGSIETQIQEKGLSSQILLARRADIAIRCANAKDCIAALSKGQTSIESSLADCLTIAIASYMLKMNMIYLLNLPEALQEFLFHSSVIWIQGSDLDRIQLDKEIIALQDQWSKWVEQSTRRRFQGKSAEIEAAVSSVLRRVCEVTHMPQVAL